MKQEWTDIVDELEALKAERDALKAERDDLISECDALRKALKPFVGELIFIPNRRKRGDT